MLLRDSMRRARAIVDLPEANLFVFAVLLNFPWELLQVPLFEGMADARHWDAILICTRAALGDGAIVMIAYWGTAAVWRDRWWFQTANRLQICAFVAVGLAITFGLEHLATRSDHPAWGWRYSELMPVALGVGLTPILQWILLPPLVLWLARRQLR